MKQLVTLQEPPKVGQFTALWKYEEEMWAVVFKYTEDGTLLLYDSSKGNFMEVVSESFKTLNAVYVVEMYDDEGVGKDGLH